MSKAKISPMGSSWDDFEKSVFTPGEIAASDIRVALISEIIKSRQELGLTQKQLEELSGVKQPVIARLEKGTNDPQLTTLIKLLTSMGKTLEVVPLKH